MVSRPTEDPFGSKSYRKMSRTVLLIGMFAMTWASFVYYPKWQMTRTEATISWDVSGYYLYLPSIFIYKDIKKLEFKPALDQTYYPSSSPYQSFLHWSGHQVMKYTCGMAILYLPFFLLAHSVAIVTGQLADGYSPIYQFFISFGSLMYAFLGLVLLRKLLLRYFADKVTAVALLVLILATNYFDYASITGAMAHNYLFTLYAALMISIDNFYKTLRWRWMYVGAGLIGLMVLIRPTEIISLILVVGWKIDSVQMLKDRFKWYITSIKNVMMGAGCFLFFPTIQVIYWKYVSSEWIVYSYQEQGFSWFEGHHILQGLFSYRAGWLVYTPVMILCLLSLVWNWIKKQAWTWMTAAFLLVSLYLTFAWDEWTYGGSLGQRSMVQHYPVFLLAMMPMIKDLLTSKLFQWALYCFIGLCIYYNLWLTHQAHRGGIYEAGMMNKAYFWHTLFKSKNDLEAKKILDTNEPILPFDTDQSIKILDTVYTADSSSCMSHGKEVTLYTTSKNNTQLKIVAKVKAATKEWDVWQMAQLIVRYQNADATVKTVLIRIHRFLNDHEEKWLDLVTSSPDQMYDHIRISVWNPSQHDLCINGLKVYVNR